MYKTLITIICILMPAICMADDFNYDDDTKIDVSDDNWDGTGKSGVSIEFDDSTTTGITQVGANEDVTRVYRNGSDVVIVSSADATIPVYRIGSPAVKMLHILPGINKFDLPRGIYIIKARKYFL